MGHLVRYLVRTPPRSPPNMAAVKVQASIFMGLYDCFGKMQNEYFIFKN